MKNKVLIFSIPALLTVFLLVGFGIGSNLFSDLSETPGFDNVPMSPMATGDSCFGAGQELHDDRSFESGGGWNATALDGRIATKFRPASYPWKYNKFCIPMTKNAGADSLVYDILIYDSTGVGGLPGVVKDSIIGVVARAIPTFPLYTWYSSDISTKNGTLVTSGSIWIAYRYNASINSAAGKFSMYDNSATTLLWPSAYSANGAAWADAIGAWPTYKAFGFRTVGQTPVVASGNVLVITNDSTTPTTPRIADRDTLKKAVTALVGGSVTYMTKNITTVFPDLSTYTTIIFQETSFDATTVRSLVATQRQAIKDWLASGTPSAKKSLIMIGADLGYAYDQAAVTQLDTVFSRSYGGFQYIMDNAAATAPLANVGLNPPGTIFDAMSITPPGAAYYPDGCRPVSGGTTFEIYQGRTTDTAAGIYKSGAGWNVISTFQDPRYFTGLGGGTGDMGFKRVLKNMIAWVRGAGGVITNTTPINGIVADKYNLSQNYPNPFNPTTKINFTIPTTGFVSLKVYNIMGQEVMTLVNENLHVGAYSVDFNGSALSSGAYFYRLSTTNFNETKKMLLVK